MPLISQILFDCAKDLGISCHEKGTMLTIEGPRFSSRAESKLWHSWGAHCINMTTVPEVIYHVLQSLFLSVSREVISINFFTTVRYVCIVWKFLCPDLSVMLFKGDPGQGVRIVLRSAGAGDGLRQLEGRGGSCTL